MTCLNLLCRLRTDIIISRGNISNNDERLGLSIFVGCLRISVQRCMLGGDENISLCAGSGSSLCPHPVSLVESCGQIVMI